MRTSSLETEAPSGCPPQHPAEAPGARNEGYQIGARAYVSTLASSLLIQGCTVLQGVFVARLLGPEGRGQFAAVMLWPTWFASIGLFGIGTALARRAGKATDLAATSRTAVVLGSFTSTIASAAALLLIPFLLPAAERALLPLAWAAVLLIPINHFTLLLQAAEQGAGRFGLLNLSRSVLYPVYLSALATLWLLHVRSVGWVVTALIAANGSCLALLVAARWRDLVCARAFERPGPIAREGVQFGLANLGTVLQQRADQILVLWLLPVEDLGVYVVALSAVSAVSGTAGALSIVAFTRSAQADVREGFPAVARDFRRAAIVSLGAAILLVPLLPFLVPLIYGSDFARASSVGMMAVAGAILAGLADILDQALRAQGRPFSGLLGRGSAVIVVFLAGFTLTSSFGMLGMAVAYVLAQLTGLTVLASSAVKHFRDGAVSLLMPRPGDVREIVTAVRRLVSRLAHVLRGVHHP